MVYNTKASFGKYTVAVPERFPIHIDQLQTTRAVRKFLLSLRGYIIVLNQF